MKVFSSDDNTKEFYSNIRHPMGRMRSLRQDLFGSLKIQNMPVIINEDVEDLFALIMALSRRKIELYQERSRATFSHAINDD